MADAGEAASRGRLRRSRRDPHTRQRAGRSIQRLYGIRTGCPAGRRTASRTHTRPRDPAAWQRSRGRYRPRAHRCAVGGDCHGLRHAGIQATGRTFPVVRHLRCRHAAARSGGARARSACATSCSGTPSGPTTTPGGPPTIASSSAATTSRTSGRRRRRRRTPDLGAAGGARTSCSRGAAAPVATTPGKACSRRRLMACPTSARTGAIRVTSLRSATAGTG